MIVVDSSAVIAILFGEPTASALIERLSHDRERVMSAVSYVETGTVLAARRRHDRPMAVADLDDFLDHAGITVASIDEAVARRALRARIAYGHGMGHGGVLNFGDAFSYAAAVSHGAPLLFVGDDFGNTDVRVALPKA